MSASVNKCILIGHLGQDPSVKYLANGDAVCNFSVATDESYKTKDGEKVEKVEWHRVVAFRRTAEVAGEYLHKGSPVYIEGKLQTRKYEKDGADHYTTEIVVDRLQLLGSKGDDERRGGDEPTASTTEARSSRAPASSRTPVKTQPSGAADSFDDDLPFN